MTSPPGVKPRSPKLYTSVAPRSEVNPAGSLTSRITTGSADSGADGAATSTTGSLMDAPSGAPRNSGTTRSPQVAPGTATTTSGGQSVGSSSGV